LRGLVQLGRFMLLTLNTREVEFNIQLFLNSFYFGNQKGQILI
jgi:hypothetical protein